MLFSSQIKMMTDRRHLLAGLGGLAATAPLGLAGASSAQATPTFEAVEQTINFMDPAQNLKSFIKVVGDLDPTKETVGWFGGDLFAVTDPGKPLKHLFGVDGMGVLRVEPQDNGAYRLFNRECAFYTDPRTREYLDTWKNPLNNEEVEVKSIHNMTVNAEVAPIFKMDFDGDVQEIPFMPPWWIQEKIDTAMSMFEVHVAAPNPMTVEEWPRESSGPINRISEMFHRSTRLSDLQNEDLTGVQYEGVWTRIGPWLPWMLQGQAEGHLLYRTFMTRPNSIEYMPDKLLKQVSDKLGEDYFKSPPPETWGGHNDSSFSVYMAENEPAPVE